MNTGSLILRSTYLCVNIWLLHLHPCVIIYHHDAADPNSSHALQPIIQIRNAVQRASFRGSHNFTTRSISRISAAVLRPPLQPGERLCPQTNKAADGIRRRSTASPPPVSPPPVQRSPHRAGTQPRTKKQPELTIPSTDQSRGQRASGIYRLAGCSSSSPRATDSEMPRATRDAAVPSMSPGIGLSCATARARTSRPRGQRRDSDT